MIKLAIVGCQGRMGRRIAELASKDSVIRIVALIERPDCPDCPSSAYGVSISRDIDAVKGADVLIDFTVPDATLKNIEACEKHGVRMVIGTTGMSDAQYRAVMNASTAIGIVCSSNMSVGVNVVFGILRKMAETLNGYDVSITETHHVHKKDAPSGTAKTMADIIQSGSKLPQVAIRSVREGEVIGYHKVTFNGPVDTIEISHDAKTRDMFAEGAIVAAKFIAGRDNGLFNMQEVLGLN